MLSNIVQASVRQAGVVTVLAFLLLAYGAWRLVFASLDIFPEFSPTLVIGDTYTAVASCDGVFETADFTVICASGDEPDINGDCPIPPTTTTTTAGFLCSIQARSASK